LILTCAHVVRKAADFQVTVVYPARESPLSAIVKAKADDGKTLDLALVELSESLSDHPCVLLDEEPVAIGQALYSYGYLESYTHAAPVRPVNEGLTGDTPPLLKLQGAQIEHGISGAALLNLKTGKVCGIVKETRAAGFDLGGGAIPTRVILEQFPELRELQQAFHEGDRRWVNLITQPGIDFQLYLQAILANEDYREWQEVYTPTTVEDRRRMPTQGTTIASQRRFSSRLKLRAETVKPDKQEQGAQPDGAQEPQEQVEQWDVLAGLRNYAAEHVVLIGKPGSGKSTSLERLLWEETEKALQDPNARIPVLVKLRRCTGTIEVMIRDFLMGHQVALEIAQIEELLRQGRFLLLLDGLNELPKAFEIEVANFRDRYRRTTPMINSTRDFGGGGTLGIEKTLKMLPLTEPQMREFVRGYLEKEGDQLFQQLKGDRLRKFAETPLLLWMLCRVFAEECSQAENEKRTPKLPENLGLAFREFTQLYDQGTDEHQAIQEDAPVDSRDQWHKLLRHLAFVMMQGKTLIDPQLSIPREKAEDFLTEYLRQEDRSNARECAERWLQDLLKYHLIQPVIQPNFEEHIEFRHQLIQEYYAAEYLLKLLPNLTDEQLKRDYLNYLKWTEPLALMLALVDEEVQAVQVVRQALDVDWRLGARLAGEVQQDWHESTVNSVKEAMRQKVSLEHEIQLLGNTHSDYASSILITRFTEEEEQDLLPGLALALRELGSQLPVQKLLPILQSGKPFIAKLTLFVLGRLGDEEIIPDLKKALRYPDENIRARAAEALGELSSDRVVPDLLSALEDTSYKVREKAVEALGNLRSELAIPELLKIATEDKSTHLPWTAAKALKKIHQEQATEELLGVLKDKDKNFKIRQKAAEALGRIGSETAIDGLIEALEDGCAAWQVARALVKIGSKKALPGLLKALEGSIPCEQAAFVLGELGDTLAVPSLINILNHWCPEVRERAVEALGKLGDKAAIPRLYELLKDSLRDNFRKKIIVALGKLGDERVSPELIEILNNQAFGSAPAWSGQWQVFDALERIGGQPVIQALKQAMGATSARIRWKAAKVLGNLKNEVAIDSLLISLADENSTVRFQSAEALGKFDSRYVMPVLSPLLKDDPNIREAAVRVLGYLEDEAAVTMLLDALNDSEWNVRYCACQSLVKLSSSKVKHVVSKALSHPWKWKLLNDGFIDAVQKLQKNCQFYNYEIWQEAESIQKATLERQKREERAITRQVVEGTHEIHHYTVNTEVFQVIEKNDGNVIGKQSLNHKSIGEQSC
jgi:HEAT repeat protein